MVSGKNYNIQTVAKQFTTKGSQIRIGSSVAAGLTRYVTMVNVTQVTGTAAKGSRVIFCSATASNPASTLALASAAQKLCIGIGSNAGSHVANKSVSVPSQPDTENPLFTVAASKFLSAKLGSAAGTSATCVVFVQYYDQ